MQISGEKSGECRIRVLSAISASSSLITLTWTAGSYNSTYKIAYQTGITAPSTCALGTLLPANQISNTSASISGISAGNYSFRVCSLNSNATPDVSSGTTVSVTTLLEAPPNANTLLAVPTSDTVIGLTWTTGGGTTASYNVSYASGATAPTTCALGTTLPSGQISGTTATVSGLTANTQYSFRVCALNANTTPDISSGTTTSMTTLLSPPPNAASLSTTAVDSTTIDLSWTGGGGSTSGYKVSYASGATAPATCALGTILPSGQISGTTASVTSLTANTQYSFRVCAANSNATPDISTGTTATATTLQISPPEVTGLTATVISDTNITLGWTSGGGTTNSYKVSYASGATPPSTCTVGTVLPGGQISGTSATVSGLNANTQYSFRVCSLNGNPTPNISSGSTTTGTTIKAAPADLSATAGANKITLSWSTVSGATNYAIYYSTSPTVTKAATRVVVAAPSYQVTSLAVSTTYYFNIAVIIGSIESDLAATEINATTYPTPPSAPGALYLSFAYNKALQLHFNTVSGAASYKAYYKTEAGVSTSDTLVAGVSDGYIISGLNTFGTYYVKISAVDAYGQESSLSNEASYQLYEYSLIPQNNASYTALGDAYVNKVYVTGSTIYTATASGVSISTDAGNTWATKNKAHGLVDNETWGVYAVGNNVYAGTTNGLSISTNAGTTWLSKTTTNGLANNTVWGIYALGSSIYAATGGGLSISTDNGLTWANKTTANGLGSNSVYKVVVSDTNIYLATSGGVSISTNSGATWVNKTTANGLGDNNIIKITVMGSNIYTSNAGGFSVSTNGGTNWTNTTTACAVPLTNMVSHYILGTNIYLSPNGGTVGICMSTNSGSTWTAKTTANGLGGNMVADVYAEGNNVYAAIDFNSSGGLSISTDSGSSWTHKAIAMPVYSNSLFAAGSNVYAATEYNGLYISTNNGATWVNKTTANGLPSISTKGVYVAGSNIYVATAGVSISTNSGSTWVNKTTANGLGSNTVRGVCADGTNIYAATTGGLAISTNGGTNWLNKTVGNGLASSNLLSVFAIGSNVYAGTNGFGLSISSNGGSTWATKNTSNGIGENHINSIYQSGTNIYLATWNGVSISTDNGATWINKTNSDNLPDNYIYSVKASGSNVYAATMSGIGISTDNGATWIRKIYIDGLLHYDNPDIAISGSIIYAASYLGGIFASGL